MNLENKIGEKPVIIGNLDQRLVDYARKNEIPIQVYADERSYQESRNKSSLGDFTRKSVVGAAYRVGASFTLDALYLTAAGAIGYYLSDKLGIADSTLTAASDFIKNLDIGKLARVAAFVVGINFVDYKWNVTENLDKGTKYLVSKMRRK